MDSASPTMLALAHQGQPLAIAAVVQQQLGNCDIDVTGWKRNELLHLELLTIDRPDKAETLLLVRQVLADLAPQHLRAVQISAYMYGLEDPCWMERLALENIAYLESPAEFDLKQITQKALAWIVKKPRWILAGSGGFMLLALAGTPGFNPSRQAPTVVQEQDPAPIRSRSSNSPDAR